MTREIAEEVGWIVHPDRLLDVWVYRIEQAGRDVLIVTYGCLVDPRSRGQHLTVSDEHLEARLFPLEQVPQLRLPDGYRRSIDAWQSLPGTACEPLRAAVAPR